MRSCVWSWVGLNYRPLPCESSALPLSYNSKSDCTGYYQSVAPLSIGFSFLFDEERARLGACTYKKQSARVAACASSVRIP